MTTPIPDIEAFGSGPLSWNTTAAFLVLGRRTSLLKLRASETPTTTGRCWLTMW